MNLTVENLGRWLYQQMEEPAFPRLAVMAGHGPDLLERSLLERTSGAFRFDHGFGWAPRTAGRDAGCYLFSVNDRLLEDVIGIARFEAQYRRSNVVRKIPEVQEHEHPVEPDAALQAPSLIRLRDDRQVPSVGPGGYITYKLRQGKVTGVASVRPFYEINSAVRWVEIDSVIETLADMLDTGLEFFPACGYYEQTWMEEQHQIEPVFDFIIEAPSGDAAYPAKWQITLPATRERD